MSYYAKSVVIDLTPVRGEPEFAILSLRELDDITSEYRCVICLRDPAEAHLCPKCTNIFGQACLRVAYNTFGGTSCPHCG